MLLNHSSRLTETCSLSLIAVYFFDIGHLCYDQLIPVKTRYLLTVSRNHIAGSSDQLIEGTSFLKLTADQVLFFNWIAGSCQVNLLKTGQDCSKAC